MARKNTPLAPRSARLTECGWPFNTLVYLLCRLRYAASASASLRRDDTCTTKPPLPLAIDADRAGAIARGGAAPSGASESGALAPGAASDGAGRAATRGGGWVRELAGGRESGDAA